MKQIEKDIQLKSDLVLLRSYQSSDITQIYEAVYESLNELLPWMYWCHPEYSIDETRQYVESRPDAWENGTEYAFAITDSRDGHFLGGCSLTIVHRVHGLAEIGYWVRSSQTKQGIATTAATLLARFGFNNLGLNRIEILTATGNKASQRVSEKVGAVREGVLINRLVVRDRVYDAVMFSLIPQDLNL